MPFPNLLEPHVRSYIMNRLLGRGATLSELASDQWEIAPAEITHVPPAIFLPGTLEKIVGTQKDTSVKAEIARIYGGKISHRSTMAYNFQDVTIDSSCIYTPRTKIRLTPRQHITPKKSDWLDLERASLGCTLYGNIYFGHWMADVQPLVLLAREVAQPLSVPFRTGQHHASYSKLLDTQTLCAVRAHVQNLTIFDDVGQNHHRRARYQTLRTRLRQLTQTSTTGSRHSNGVMLLRGNSGTPRQLINEQTLAQMLSARGFDIINPSTCEAAEVIQRTLDARIVVGVEGSQLAHATYTIAQKGAMVVLQPPWRFNNSHKDRMDGIGVRYAVLVGDTQGNGFTIDPEQLLRTLDLVDSALG